jgi:hypothetical protein
MVGMRDQPIDTTHQSGLSAATRSSDENHTSGSDTEGQAVQGKLSTSLISEAQVINLQWEVIVMLLHK